jgi:hypothetical protein
VPDEHPLIPLVDTLPGDLILWPNDDAPLIVVAFMDRQVQDEHPGWLEPHVLLLGRSGQGRRLWWRMMLDQAKVRLLERP